MITNKHKKVIISSLYGLMEGSPSSVLRMIERNWERIYQFEPYDDLTINHTDKIVESDKFRPGSVWVGSMTLTLKMGEETYSVTRDWGKEYEIDITHPNYKSLWFYEMEYAEGNRIWNEILTKIGEA